MSLTDLGDADRASHQARGSLRVVVLRVCRRPGVSEQAAVEHACRDDVDAAALADRQQLVERACAPGACIARRASAGPCPCRARIGRASRTGSSPPRSRRPALPSAAARARGTPVERRRGSGRRGRAGTRCRCAPRRGGPALLEGAQDAVGTEVEHPPEGRGDREAFVVGPPWRVDRPEEASGLGREHELVTGARPQGVAETAFGQSEPVVRRRVEGADPESQAASTVARAVPRRRSRQKRSAESAPRRVRGAADRSSPHRSFRAAPASRSTSASVAMDASPGVVIARAPWAARARRRPLKVARSSRP